MDYHRHVSERPCSGKRYAIDIDHEEVAHGYLYLMWNDQHTRPFGFIEDVFVSAHDRGKGYGKEIVEWLIEEARNADCYKIVLSAREGRDRLHAWYESLGFTKHGLSFRMDL